MPPQVWKPGCDVALCTVGRVGENLESLQRTTEGLRALTPGISIVALTEEHESELAGRSLIAGADQVQPLPGLTPTLLGVAIKIAYARKLRHDTATRRKEKLPEVPGYRILRQIGEGGMSRVYLAKRGNEESAVVLKIVDAQLARDQKFVLRFARECKVLASIRHENVVRISDFSIDTRRPYLAMEYFANGDLKSRLRGGLRAVTALKIMMQLMKAIDAVHTAGLVHRDLKPHNIMFRTQEQMALVDFGLVKPIDVTTSQAHLTQDGMVLATPVYMSPEQCLGRQQDARSDLYSCGIILFEMLAGKPPFSGDDPGELAYQHVNARVPKLPAKVAGFQPVIDRLLAKNPDDRFQSARDLFAHIAI